MAITFETVKGALKKGVAKRAAEARVVVVRVAGPASYATGGFDVTVGELSQVTAAIVAGGSGYSADVDYANSNKNVLRIKVYSAAGTEVTAGTNLSGVYFTVTAFGW